MKNLKKVMSFSLLSKESKKRFLNFLHNISVTFSLKINVLSSPTGFPKSKTEYSSIKT